MQIVPKGAKVGDKVFLFYSPDGFLGQGEIVSAVESTTFGSKQAYGADVGNIKLFESPIPLDTVAARFPKWGWTRYTRSYTTPDPEIAKELSALLLREEPAQNDQEEVRLSEVEVEIAVAAVHAAEETLARAQGFTIDPKRRKAIEDRAMEAAMKHYGEKGYDVKDRRKKKPYDLYCYRGKEKLYVEVKGTQGDGSRIILTKNEVQFAREHSSQMALFVLHGIRIEERDGTVVASGGKEAIRHPWIIEDGSLTPISYFCDLTV